MKNSSLFFVCFFLVVSILHAEVCSMNSSIIIWDNDGTIIGSKNPNDPCKIVLPNVETVMRKEGTLNVVCSGCKTPESESCNFDQEAISARLKKLMTQLPISIATFSPAIGGTECWVIIKKENNIFEIRRAHEDKRYQHLIGQFKKPGIGMLVVIKDLLEERGIIIDKNNCCFIGDSWHDEHAAKDFNIPFVSAHNVHSMA